MSSRSVEAAVVRVREARRVEAVAAEDVVAAEVITVAAGATEVAARAWCTRRRRAG